MDSLRTLASHLHPRQPFSEHQGGDEVFEVSAPASSAASVYEKIRNTFDYQEEHLLRRNAIVRMLKRYVGGERALSAYAQDLLRELIWARYLPNKVIPLAFADTVREHIARYEVLFTVAHKAHDGAKREEMYRWILDLVATDIDALLVPTDHEEALAAYMYDEVRKRLTWDEGYTLSQEERDLRIFTAVHRVLLKSNPGVLRFRLFTLYYRDWYTASPERLQEIAEQLPRSMTTIDRDIAHPLADKIMRLIRRKAGLFRVLGDALRDAKGDITQPAVLDKAIEQGLAQRVGHFRVRLQRTVVRSVLFLFLTKMLLALLIELPYDLFLHEGNVPLYPLFINIFFHPCFLAVIGLTVTLPGKENVQDYLAAARALAVGADHPLLHTRIKIQRQSSWTTMFGALYALLFVGVYGAIGYGLHFGGFHGLSISLFLFFLSLVTFFGIRIRLSVRDIVLSDTRSGFLGSLFDVVFLPIIKAGSWLSTKVAKINIFIYFFDFIIEAPLKVAIEFIEGWLTFIREKKEEI